MWDFLAKLFKPIREAMPVYTIDDTGFHEIKIDGTEKDIAWSEIDGVDILTTADGPFLDDFFYIISGNGTFICIDQFKAAELEILDKFQRLQGFDWEMVIKASCCIELQSFSCWKKNPEPAKVGP